MFFDRPMSSGPRDRVVGHDDAGNPVYETILGHTYVQQAPERQESGRESVARALFNAGRNPDVKLRDMAGGLLGGLAKAAWQGVSAPGRAARGEPVTYGDAWATALDWGALGPVGRAPKGALRSGASRSDDGIRAYHGSPHDFDEFRMDRIGTGEGAQAYGHGLYFAENPSVAEMYKRVVPGGGSGWGGLPNFDDAMQRAIDALPERMKADLEIRWQNDGPDAAKKLAFKLFEENRGTAISDDLHQLGVAGEWPSGSGRMYEVRLRADPDDFLDWDAPLSEQPGVLNRLGMSARPEDAIHDEALRLMEEGNARAGRAGGWQDFPELRSRIDELQNELDTRAPNITGQEYYRGGRDGDVSNILSQMGYGNPAAQSDALREAGIPGIRYRDQLSRGTEGGTRNFVVFDESIIEIVRKYGIAGAAALLGVSASEVEAGMDRARQDQADAVQRYRERAQ